jgi:tetratricopeptide (TPR) repeat protein
VRRGGSRLRITAQLVDAATGNHLWAERYDRELADVFAVQDEITERVVAAIEPELYAAEHVRSQRKPPDSLDAWECGIRALSCIGQGTREANIEAETLCRRAIAIAPNYGQAHSLLAWTLWRRGAWSGGSATLLTEAMAAAIAARDLGEGDPWAHLALGTVFYRMCRYDEAQQALRRALELNPNFALAHAFLGVALAFLNREDEAIASGERALRLSPADRLVGAYGSVAIAHAHFAARRYTECVAWARKTIERSDFVAAYCMLIAAAAISGDMISASSASTDLLRLQPGFSLAWTRENTAYSGEELERLLAGLRKAEIPEE